ncbi:MAG: hypothetical protein AVDCRST_MAG76-3248 [uncultured Acidimicrobiales bacterium]|uniref:Uncharacterized protein n=1 Tax=uncultured Acidimicrobiales bacterium TaxID=310071 RepID=A0A6J4J7F5_9ACTN|nr:MAG: hypothetical protein AVDCRST_MAG76-3248 [uncultured Acidimicrobiales bacterium]
MAGTSSESTALTVVRTSVPGSTLGCAALQIPVPAPSVAVSCDIGMSAPLRLATTLLTPSGSETLARTDQASTHGEVAPSAGSMSSMLGGVGAAVVLVVGRAVVGGDVGVGVDGTAGEGPGVGPGVGPRGCPGSPVGDEPSAPVVTVVSGLERPGAALPSWRNEGGVVASTPPVVGSISLEEGRTRSPKPVIPPLGPVVVDPLFRAVPSSP